MRSRLTAALAGLGIVVAVLVAAAALSSGGGGILIVLLPFTVPGILLVGWALRPGPPRQ